MIRSNDVNPPPAATPPESPGEGKSDEAAPATAATANPTNDAPKPVRRKRRWGRRILAGLLLFVVLVIVGVQAVLMSDLPRKIMLSAITDSLGVKAEASAVSLGWFGDASVADLKLSLPLEEGSLLEAQSVSVKTNNLLSIAIFGLDLRQIDVQQPIVNLRQLPSGRWNLSDLLNQLGGGSGGSAGGGTPAPSTGRPKFPAVQIHNALVNVTPHNGQATRIGPVEITGSPDPAAPELVWTFRIAANQQFDLSGRVAPGGEWRHQIKLDVSDVRPIASAFGASVPPVQLLANWEGRSAGGVHGLLKIDRFTAGGLPANGVLAIETDPAGVVRVRPQGLKLLGTMGTPPLVADGGAVVLEGGSLRTDGLMLRAGGGAARIDASYTAAGRTGTLAAHWQELALPDGVSHAGSLTAKLGLTLTGDIDLTANLRASGELAAVGSKKFEAVVDARATGPSFTELSATISAPRLAIPGPRRLVVLDGLKVRAVVSEKLDEKSGGDIQRQNPGVGVAVQSVQLGNTDRIAASGFLLPVSGQWGAQFAGKYLPLPFIAAEALAIDVEAAGEPDVFRLRRLKVALSDTVITAAGTYISKRPEPLEVIATIDRTPPASRHEATAMGVRPQSPAVMYGRIAGRGQIVGTLSGPRRLRIDGELQGMDVKIADRDIGGISIDVKGLVDERFARLWRDETKPLLKLLGANWDLKAEHDFEQELSSVSIAIRDWNLSELGETFGQQEIVGTAAGDFWFRLPQVENVPLEKSLTAGGGLTASKLAYRGFEIDSATAGLKIADGEVELPLAAKRLSGSAGVTVRTTLSKAEYIDAQNLRIESWPVVLPPATALVISGGGSTTRLLLPDAKAADPALRQVRFSSGPLKFQTSIRVKDIDAGSASLTAFLHNRTVDVPLAQAWIFDSNLLASATVDLDNPNGIIADLALKNVDPQRVLELVPSLYGVNGKFDLFATIQPDSNPNALEPLVIDATFDSHNLSYRQVDGPAPATAPSATQPLTTQAAAQLAVPGLQIGDGRLRAQLRLAPDFTLERGVLADQSGVYRPPDDRNRVIGPLPPNTLQLANGRVTFWGRVTHNQNDRGRDGFDTRTLHGRVAFEALDLNQVVQAADPDKKFTPGKLDGSFIFYGTTRTDENLVKVTAPAARAGRGKPPTTMFEKTIAALQGEGELRIREADIGTVNVVSSIYSLLRLGQDLRTPTGTGAATFRVEDNRAYLTSARYFNRGLEIRATATVGGLHRMQQATIRGDAFGSVRALKDVEIPIVRSIVPDIDEILAAVQSSGVSVTFDGPVTDPNVKPIFFRELGDSLRELILGDYRDSRNRQK